MRTAEEILNGYVRRGYGYIKKDIIAAINEARKEALEEAVQITTTKQSDYVFEIESLINKLR